MEEDVRVKNIREFLKEHVPEMLDFPEDDKKQFMLTLWNRFNINQGQFQLYKKAGSNAYLSIYVMARQRGGDYLFGVRSPSDYVGDVYSITYDTSTEDTDSANVTFNGKYSLFRALGCALMGDKFLEVCDSW